MAAKRTSKRDRAGHNGWHTLLGHACLARLHCDAQLYIGIALVAIVANVCIIDELAASTCTHLRPAPCHHQLFPLVLLYFLAGGFLGVVIMKLMEELLAGLDLWRFVACPGDDSSSSRLACSSDGG